MGSRRCRGRCPSVSRDSDEYARCRRSWVGIRGGRNALRGTPLTGGGRRRRRKCRRPRSARQSVPPPFRPQPVRSRFQSSPYSPFASIDLENRNFVSLPSDMATAQNSALRLRKVGQVVSGVAADFGAQNGQQLGEMHGAEPLASARSHARREQQAEKNNALVSQRIALIDT